MRLLDIPSKKSRSRWQFVVCRATFSGSGRKNKFLVRRRAIYINGETVNDVYNVRAHARRYGEGGRNERKRVAMECERFLSAAGVGGGRGRKGAQKWGSGKKTRGNSNARHSGCVGRSLILFSVSGGSREGRRFGRDDDDGGGGGKIRAVTLPRGWPALLYTVVER